MKELATYTVRNEGVPAEISIIQNEEDYINTYELRHTRVKQATKVILDYLKEKIIEAVDIKISEVLDPREQENVKQRLIREAHRLIQTGLQGVSREEEDILVGMLVQEMLGLGEMELVLSDEQLEEIVINSAREPVYVYHRKFGWLKTNLLLNSEEQIHNYASIIGRRVGRQVTTLNPLMDANLTTGNRVNVTLFPISTKGNGMTIRKFRSDPWTIISLLDVKTLTSEIAALLWMGVQYEMNILIAGGTASGKTSFLNSILVFTPPNQRVVSIEDTRELQLPDYMHWTPLVTRQANPEGKGAVEMLDLMVNSLRMRPDRIVVGETRRQREAEVLFEAMHTGHSVYSTLHADQASQVRTRLITPPIALPEESLSALHMVVVQYRQRRTGQRKTFELAEIRREVDRVGVHVAYSYDARTDSHKRHGAPTRIFEELSLHTGLSDKEIEQELANKQRILEHMLVSGVRSVNEVGRVVGKYYRDPDSVLRMIERKAPKEELLR